MATITVDGIEFEYDENALRSYRVIRGITSYQKDPAGFFDALDIIFAGKSVEYADALGGSLDDMSRLVTAVMETAATGPAKN